ncbi:MAG: hypothetical protein KF789_13165 [Bdellovibrionaceae bacterium]|nr:hypothetical protein [Pseudobdellovibrionaceae bacterium]
MTVSAGDWRESVAKRSRIAGREKNDPGWNQDCAAVLSLVVLCIDVFAAEFAGSLCILLDTLIAIGELRFQPDGLREAEG